jgi:hypothetical protein
MTPDQKLTDAEWLEFLGQSLITERIPYCEGRCTKLREIAARLTDLAAENREWREIAERMAKAASESDHSCSSGLGDGCWQADLNVQVEKLAALKAKHPKPEEKSDG